MKTTLRVAAAAAALAFAAPSFAQQSAHPRVGLGVSMNSSLIAPLLTLGNAIFAPPTQLYVPFYVAPNVRIEPQFGWLSVHDDTDDVTSRSFSLGVGAVLLKPVAQSTNLYVGGRLVSTWLRDENRVNPTTVAKTTQRNTTLAAVFGGEYLPSPWFSVGLEAQLEFTALGDPETETAGITVTGQGGSSKATQGLFFLRVYFL